MTASDPDNGNKNQRSASDNTVTSIEMTELPLTPDPPSVERGTIALHRHVLNQFRDAQRSLLAIRSLGPLINYLVDGLPVAFASSGAELRLHDPEGDLARLLRKRAPAGKTFSLHSDSYALYELFDDAPEVAYLTLDDSRMFRLLSEERDACGAVLMPLMDGNRLVGTYLLGLVEGMSAFDDRDLELFSMLGQLIASAFLQVVAYQQADRLALLDGVTEMGNYRAFTRDLEREIQWAKRSSEPLALIMVGLDDIEEIARSHGEIARHFVERRVSQRLCSDLRATDYISRLDETRFGILLPACNEPNAYDIGERLRQDVDDFAMDDGRGSVLYVTLSVGIVCWDPSSHPVENAQRLVVQLDAEVDAALAKSARAGGNRVSVSRLGVLMV